MKLYATVTSERGKPATKGGNDYIHVTLNVGTQPTYFIGLWPNGTLVVEDIATMQELYRREIECVNIHCATSVGGICKNITCDCECHKN